MQLFQAIKALRDSDRPVNFAILFDPIRIIFLKGGFFLFFRFLGLFNSIRSHSKFSTKNGIDSPHNKQLLILLILVVLILYTLLSALYLRLQNSIECLDFWYHMDLGYRVSWPQLVTFTDGLYPIGYPLLLRLAIDNGIDGLRFGQFLSWMGGGVALLSLLGAIYHTTRKASIAFAGALLLLMNLNFFTYATREGTDMLATGLQILAVYVIWLIESKDAIIKSRLLICVAGFLLGLAYLVRYTSLILLPIVALYILWKMGRPIRKSAKNISMLLGIFFLTASPQIIPSTIVHSSPFYNLQAKNVWFGLYGQADWVNNWAKVPNTISLLEVISIDPGYFLDHWLQQVLRAFSPHDFWPSILHWAWLLGGITLVFNRRWHPANRFLAVLVLVTPILATSMAWISPRHLLTSIVMQSLMIALLAEQIMSFILKDKQIHHEVIPALLVLITVLVQVNPLVQHLRSPIRTKPQEVNHFLRIAGMQNPSQVVTNDPFLHATDIPARTRYTQAIWFVSNPKSIHELLNQMPPSNWRYFVFNFENGFGNYDALKDSVFTARSLLVPLQLDNSAVVLCIAPCMFDDIVTDKILFDSGMELIGHKLIRGEGGLSLYLYWQTDKSLVISYKVCVRIQDAEGNILLQVDNVPQLGTYPTTSWPVHTLVTDFYYLEPDFVLPHDFQIALVIYEEQSTENSQAKDRMGNRLGQVVLLKP